MLLHLLGLKGKVLVKVSLGLHSLAAYPNFPPRAGQGFSLPGSGAALCSGDFQQSGTEQVLLF